MQQPDWAGRFRTLGATACALLLSCCHSYVPQQPLGPAPLPWRTHVAVGCWRLESDSAVPPFFTPPAELRLDTLAVEDWSGPGPWLQMVPGPGILVSPNIPPMAYWQADSAGPGVRIEWGDGFIGFTLNAAVVGDSLDGHGRTNDDLSHTTGPYHIWGHRVACV